MPRSSKVRIKATFNQKDYGSKEYAGGTAGVSIGRSVNQFSTSDMGELPELVAQSLARTVERANRSYFFSRPAKALAKDISDAIDRELHRIGQFITAQLIGITSGPDDGGSTFIDKFEGSDIELEWRNLANITRRKKSANKNKFFLDTAALRTEIRSKAGAGLVKLNTGFKGRPGKGAVSYGCVTIRPYYFTADTGRRVYKIADIEINLLAGAPVNVAQPILTQTIFNQSQNPIGNMPKLAALMGLSPSAIQKLSGGVMDRKRDRVRSGFAIGSSQNRYTGQDTSFYRPLLEPSIAYFFQTRVPLAVQRAMNRARANKGRKFIQGEMGVSSK